MKITFRKLLTLLIAFFGALLFIFMVTHQDELPLYIKNIEHLQATQPSKNPLSQAEIFKNKYAEALKTGNKIKILIVPGHEPNSGGAQYKGLLERDMAVDLSNDLAQYFKNDPHFEAIITRDKNDWDPIFKNYFSTHQNDIRQFISLKKAKMAQLINSGTMTEDVDAIDHIDVPNDVAVRLYGINKWANENQVDLLIHVHFSEYPRKKQQLPGKYTGLTLYVPDAQYSNGQITSEIATSVLDRLTSLFPISNLPKESKGIVEEQNLIAIGTANTLNSPSLLIEYGYIYDSLFINAKQKTTFDAMAKETFLGTQDFFATRKSSQIAVPQ